MYFAKQHQLANSLNNALNSIWHQAANGNIIKLDKKLFCLEQDYELKFDITSYQNERCTFSGGNWNSRKFESLKNMSKNYIHIQTPGRYDETSNSMALEEFAEAYDIKDHRFLDYAAKINQDSGQKMAHISKAVQKNHYIPNKEVDIKNFMKMRKNDKDKLVTLFSNNPGEFPFEGDLYIMNSSGSCDSTIRLRYHRAEYLNIKEQCATRSFLDKYIIVFDALEQLMESNSLSTETTRHYEQLKEIKALAIAQWVKNFPNECKSMYPKVWEQHNKTDFCTKVRNLLSPKRKREESGFESSKKLCVPQ